MLPDGMMAKKTGQIPTGVILIPTEPHCHAAKSLFSKGPIHPRLIVLPRRAKYQPSPSAI
jgi:hypothetical protein